MPTCDIIALLQTKVLLIFFLQRRFAVHRMPIHTNRTLQFAGRKPTPLNPQSSHAHPEKLMHIRQQR